MNKLKYMVVLVFAVLFSFIMGVMAQGDVKESDSSREQIWRQLKEIDDKGLEYSALFAAYCSDGFTAVVDQDASRLDIITANIKYLNTDVRNLAKERLDLLKQLGYDVE